MLLSHVGVATDTPEDGPGIRMYTGGTGIALG